MCHEFRAHLHIVASINQVLQDAPVSAQQRYDYLKKMNVAIQNILAISSVVLDLARLHNNSDESAVAAKPFVLNELLFEINSLFSILAQQKGLSLHVELLPEPSPEM